MKKYYTREDIENYIKENKLNISIYDDFRQLVKDAKFNNQDYQKISEYTDGLFDYNDAISYSYTDNNNSNNNQLLFIHYNKDNISDAFFQEVGDSLILKDIIDMVKISINYLQNNDEANKKQQAKCSFDINDLL